MPAAPRAKWLEPISWADVSTLNARLCEARGALHKPASDGHDAARDLWEISRQMVLTWEQAIVICHRCHRLAPFCFFNGNTFVAIARGIIRPVLEQLTARDAMGAAAFRSVVGHFVAGTEGLEELRAALRDALD